VFQIELFCPEIFKYNSFTILLEGSVLLKDLNIEIKRNKGKIIFLKYFNLLSVFQIELFSPKILNIIHFMILLEGSVLLKDLKIEKKKRNKGKILFLKYFNLLSVFQIELFCPETLNIIHL
jgi:hypothetical protein